MFKAYSKAIKVGHIFDTGKYSSKRVKQKIITVVSIETTKFIINKW